MNSKDMADSMPVKNLKSKEKRLLGLALSVVLPALILVYLFLDLIAPEFYHEINNRQFINVYFVVALAIFLSVLGLALVLRDE